MGDLQGEWDGLWKQIRLSGGERKVAEAYLSGVAGEEALESLHFRDLSKTIYGASQKRIRELLQEKKEDVLKRLFSLLFAVGEATCYWMMPMELYHAFGRLCDAPEELSDAAAAKVVSVYAVVAGLNLCDRNENPFALLLKLAKDDPEIIRQALEYEKNEFINGKWFLLTVYFFAKYHGKRHGGVEEGDLPLLARCEEYALACFVGLYFPAGNPSRLSIRVYPGGAVEKRLVDAVVGVGFDEVQKEFAGRKPEGSRPLFHLTVGLCYINHMFSDQLKNVLRLCLAAGPYECLDAMQRAAAGTPLEVAKAGGAYDDVFGMDAGMYIRWALGHGYGDILKYQAGKNTECYLRVMEGAGAKEANQLLLVIKEQDGALYEKLLAKNLVDGRREARDRVISELVKESADVKWATAYLQGRCRAAMLYPINWEDGRKRQDAGKAARALVDSYLGNYADAGFFRRCAVYMLLCKYGNFFQKSLFPLMDWQDEVDVSGVKEIFACFQEEEVPFPWQVLGVELIHRTLPREVLRQSFLEAAGAIFLVYWKEGKRREELQKAFASAGCFGRFFALAMLRQDAQENQGEILKYAKDNTKMVKKVLFDILCENRGWEQEVKALLAGKWATERELAGRVLLAWQKQDEEQKEQQMALMEKEENVNEKELLDGMAKFRKAEELREKFVAALHKDGGTQMLGWAYETPFPDVHRMDGKTVEERYLQAVLLCYARGNYKDGRHSSMAKIQKNAAALVKDFRMQEFEVYVNELFDRWALTDPKKKRYWVFYVASSYGGAAIIDKLEDQITQWQQREWDEPTCEALWALGLSPLPQAALVVDRVSRRFRSGQVRKTANAILDALAAQKKMTRGELIDLAIPGYGFRENMERYIDYGERGFRVRLTPNFEFEAFKKNGKTFTRFPRPGKKDDKAKAAAVYDAYKELKKQIRTTVGSQKQRMEQMLAVFREWEAAAWVQLFTKNVVMCQFAISLVWGVYGNGELVQAFRYLGNGAFCTEDGGEYKIPGHAKIRLVHPVEITEKSRKAWGEQFLREKIGQPFEQVDRTVYTLGEAEAGQRALLRFEGRSVEGKFLDYKLLEMDWYRGPMEDGNHFTSYYRRDGQAGFEVWLHFSGNDVDGMGDEEVTVYDIRFYRVCADGQDGDVDGMGECAEAGLAETCFLRDIPARYFSEIVWQIVRAGTFVMQ